jgi:beta-barrel assembly-enhancing protease
MTVTYIDPENRSYQATLVFSTITITIRVIKEDQQEQEIHWLADRILPFIETVSGYELHYRNHQDLIEKIIIRDRQVFNEIRSKYKKFRFTGSSHYRYSWTGPLTLISSLVGIFFLAYLVIIPWIGELVANRVSKEWETNLGDNIYQSMISGYTIDQQRTKAINQFYRSSGYKIPYHVRITVVKEKELNAFALPGGNIIVHDALLRKLQYPEQLAALLGHEASHISERHSLRNIFRTFSRQMFLSLILGNSSGMASVLIEQADALKALHYSRSLETEADNLGLALMEINGIDLNGMLTLMQILQKETGSAEPSSFLSTHPVFSERIKNIHSKITTSRNAIDPNEELETIFQSLK